MLSPDGQWDVQLIPHTCVHHCQFACLLGDGNNTSGASGKPLSEDVNQECTLTGLKTTGHWPHNLQGHQSIHTLEQSDLLVTTQMSKMLGHIR